MTLKGNQRLGIIIALLLVILILTILVGDAQPEFVFGYGY